MNPDAVLVQKSTLAPNTKRMLPLKLIQAASGRSLIGTRILSPTYAPSVPSEEAIDDCKSLLRATAPNAITVISFHPGLSACERELTELSKDRTIVGLAGVSWDRRNLTFMAASGSLVKQMKISLSSEDEECHVERGCALYLFLPGVDHPEAIRWAVLNCHDYTHVDLIYELQKHRIELLIVVTYNTATRLFWQYAVCDVHRLFCYVVVANVAELGGSGVFAPFRRVGRESNAQLSTGGQVFGARGPSNFEVDLELDFGELRTIRKEFSEYGFRAPKIQEERGSVYAAMVPSEHYMDTLDRRAGAPPFDRVREVRIDWNFNNPRVAFAQLNHIGREAYIDSKYRIRRHASCREFEYLLSVRLMELETRCRRLERKESGALLDLLIFPEVFVPRSFLGTLQGFSDRVGAMVIAGVDYPEGEEEANANECAVICPGKPTIWYRKITRSQYDACRDNSGNRMPMRRGAELLRLVGTEGRGIGLLICYDFSHFDLMWSLNLHRREMPLDLTVVVAHNPFGDLYRSCCIADAHRFYQYVVMCNVADYGGSGVFGPIRTAGARQVIAEAGKGIETIALIELDLRELNAARHSSDHGLHRGAFMRRPGVFQRRWP